MKKITQLLSFLLMMLSIQIFAQYEDFESTAVGSVPNGWTTYQSQSDDPGFSVQDQNGYAYEGTQYLVHEGVDISSESTSWVVSNSIHLGVSYELKFAWRGRWSNDYNYSGVYISTSSSDPVANPGDFTELSEFSPSNFPNTWLQWNNAFFDLAAYDNQDVYIAFKYVGDHSHDFYIDKLEVGPMPFCDSPQDLAVTARGLDYLDIDWTSVVGAYQYEVAWGAPGFDPNNNPPNTMLVTTNSAHITGLAQETEYDIYVRTVCSSYNQSLWAGPAHDITLGPPPANDDCANAIDLTVYDNGASVGHETDGNTLNAFDSGMHPTCDDIGVNLDLWYTFTVPAGEDKVVVITGGAEGSNIEAALFDSCGGTELDCKGNGSFKTFTGLTAGQTYTLQVWLDEFNSGLFNIAIEKAPPAPSNDECANAMNLTVFDSGTSAGNETAGDTTAATDSNMHPSCDNTGTNLDLWYTFTVPAGEDKVIVLTGGAGGSDIEAALYDSCGGTELDCQGNGSSKTFSGLTGGQTYTLQVWHDDFNKSPFNIAIEKAPPAPSNDECANAINLTVFDIGASAGNETPGNTMSATDSSMHPSCDDFGTNLDLWYTFTVPAGEDKVVVLTGGAQGVSIEAALYDSCGGAELDCQNGSSSKIFSGLTAGQTYTLQIWHDDFNAGPFSIAIEKVPGAPANDICSGAIPLTVTNSCSPTYANNTSTSDSGVPDPGCGNYQGGDLWFSIVVPSSGSVTIETEAGLTGSITDTGLAVYSGDCTNLSLIDCNDDNGTDYFSRIELTGRTAGETIYIRVWEYGNNSFGNFGVCAYDSSVSLSENNIEGLRVYPNPVNNILNISAQENIQSIAVYNISGQEVLSLQPNNTQQEIDMSHLLNGMYFVKIQVNNKLSAFKIIKE